MNPITHFLMGWTVASCVPSLIRRERALVTWASIIPDVDGFGIVAEWVSRNSTHPLNWWSEYHHIFHNLGVALLVAAMAGILARPRLKTAALAFISFHLHLFGDLVGARGPEGEQWPIPYLLPFSNQPQLVWSGQWALNAWPNFVITGALLAITLALGRSRGFSPLEMFSVRADAVIVTALQSRFPLRSGNIRE